MKLRRADWHKWEMRDLGGEHAEPAKVLEAE
jgi:hypothetical protein